MIDFVRTAKTLGNSVDDVALLSSQYMRTGNTMPAAGSTLMPDNNQMRKVHNRISNRFDNTQSDMMNTASPLPLASATSSMPAASLTSAADATQNIHGKAANLAALATHEAYRKTHKKDVGEEAGAFKAVAPVEKIAETGSSIMGVGILATDLVLPAIGVIAGLAGLNKTKSVLNKPRDLLNPDTLRDAGKLTTGDKIQNGLFLTGNILSTYGVAKGFSQNLDSLKNMYSDVTGVPVENVSTMAILTGNVPDVIKSARSHFLKEHLARGAVNAVGLGLVARSIFKGKNVGLIEGLAPMAAGAAVDAVMGESVLPFYTGFANAFREGKPMEAAAYSEFLISTSEDLKKRGAMGHRMAILLGEEYAKEQKSPAELLKEIESSQQAHKAGGKGGAFDERIERILTRIEEQKAHAPKAAAPKAAQPQAKMVDKLQGNQPADMKVQGKFTQRLQQEVAGRDHGLAGRVT